MWQTLMESGDEVYKNNYRKLSLKYYESCCQIASLISEKNKDYTFIEIKSLRKYGINLINLGRVKDGLFRLEKAVTLQKKLPRNIAAIEALLCLNVILEHPLPEDLSQYYIKRRASLADILINS